MANCNMILVYIILLTSSELTVVCHKLENILNDSS